MRLFKRAISRRFLSLLFSNLALRFNFTSPNQGALTKPSSNVTKAEVVQQIAEKTGIDKADVYTTVEAFFSVVKNSMAEGESIYVRGFGSFVNKKRAKKIGRNISKNTAMVIEEHFVPSFKPSKVFVDKIKKSNSIKATEAR